MVTRRTQQKSASSLSTLVPLFCEQVPERYALGVFPDNTSNRIEYFTYRQLGEKVLALAAALQVTCQFPPGSRVIICAANSPEWLITDLALVVAGLVAVPLHTLLMTKTVEAVMELVQPVGVFCDQSTQRWFTAHAHAQAAANNSAGATSATTTATATATATANETATSQPTASSTTSSADAACRQKLAHISVPIPLIDLGSRILAHDLTSIPVPPSQTHPVPQSQLVPERSTNLPDWATYSFHTLAVTVPPALPTSMTTSAEEELHTEKEEEEEDAATLPVPPRVYPALKGDDLASIMFTSGSTGKSIESTGQRERGHN